MAIDDALGREYLRATADLFGVQRAPGESDAALRERLIEVGWARTATLRERAEATLRERAEATLRERAEAPLDAAGLDVD